MKPRHKRLALISLCVIGLTGASLLVLNAFRNNLLYFSSPTDIAEGKVQLDRTFRLGGMVEQGSVRRSGDGLTVDFAVTDFRNRLSVRYKGILPDLFRECQGVVTDGRLIDGLFMADKVLAKHDENYMPPEAAKALQGRSCAPSQAAYPR
jgi:cytochrome c-type biogenesis protein CcmE